MKSSAFDIVVIGGGILGISTALTLSTRFPKYTIGVLEKESELASHQTGHNSGVIHSGIYYRPGSLKAENCVTGAQSLLAFCDENKIEYELCGKVIVATNENEIPSLEELNRRGTANNVRGLEMIGPERLKEIEPFAVGLKALYSPCTGIVDYTKVTKAFAKNFLNNGGTIHTSTEVLSLTNSDSEIIVETNQGDFKTKFLINCAGLQSDKMARKFGWGKDLRIIPFRGEYYSLINEAKHLVKGLIYPVPDPAFPFLGVHYTRTIYGDVEAGPNAVLAFSREGYKMKNISPLHLLEIVGYPGFWRMARKYWKTGLLEFYRSISKASFLEALQKLVPEIKKEHLSKGGSGVRAQAVERDGFLVDDFRINETRNAIHVLNAPSPGATASISIAAKIVDMATNSFKLDQ